MLKGPWHLRHQQLLSNWTLFTKVHLKIVSFILSFLIETKSSKYKLLILAELPCHSLTVNLLVTHHSQLLLKRFNCHFTITSWHHHNHHKKIYLTISPTVSWLMMSTNLKFTQLTYSQVWLTWVLKILVNKIFDVKTSSLT